MKKDSEKFGKHNCIFQISHYLFQADNESATDATEDL